MRGARQDRQERARAGIVSAAAALLARDGYAGFSMRELARATGRSLATLYNYFASKDDVLFEVQSRAFDTLIASAQDAARVSDPPEARLHAFVFNHVRYVAAHPDVLRVLVQQAGALPPARRRAIRLLKERYYALGMAAVRAVMEERGAAGGPAVSPEELERATYTVFGMLNWVYAWFGGGRHGSAEDVARTIHAMAVGGLALREPSRQVQRQTERRVARAAVVPPLQEATAQP